jgi:hypothetical protein
MNKKVKLFVSIILLTIIVIPGSDARPQDAKHWAGPSKPLPKPSKVKFNVSSCEKLDQSVSRQADAMVAYIGKRTATNKNKAVTATQELSTIFLYNQKNFPESIRPYMRKVSEAAVEDLTRISSKGVLTWSYSIDNAYLEFVGKIREIGYVGSKCL